MHINSESIVNAKEMGRSDRRPDRVVNFSIVVPVFNAAKYIRECLDSILFQRFDETFEIIIVDDGSTDESAGIAEHYHRMWPYIITILRQVNGGPSAARNSGFAIARGTWVIFLDADDRLATNVLERVYRFCVLYPQSVDIITIPIRRYDGRRGSHPLNYKFDNGSRIVDLETDPDAILRHTTSSFIRRTALPSIPFEDRVRYGEDAFLILRVLAKRPRYGVVRGTQLLKRSRREGSSLLDQMYDTADNLEQVTWWHTTIIEESIQRFRAVPPYVQASLLYDYQWQARSLQFGYAFRDPKRREAYLNRVRDHLAIIEDERIRVARHLRAAEKLLLYRMKRNVRESVPYQPLLSSAWDLPEVQLLFIESGEQVVIEGRAFTLDHGTLRAMVNGAPAKLDIDTALGGHVHFFGEDVRCYAGFRLVLPQPPSSLRLEFAWEYLGRLITLGLHYGDHCGLAVRGARRYGVLAGLVFVGCRRALVLGRSTARQRIFSEANYIVHLISRARLRPAGLRLLGHASRMLMKSRPAIIFLDRNESAGDNAERLFCYLVESAEAHARLIFSVARSSRDYGRLKNVGPTIAYGSLRHKFEMFAASMIVSSHCNPSTFNPFGREERFLRDLLRFKRVFITHGIMNSTQCKWLGRDVVNLDMITATTRSEYDLMLSANIGYTDKHVRLTGMTRYDSMADRRRGDRVVLMPTWRSSLLDRIGKLKSFAEKAAAFAASEYTMEWRATAADVVRNFKNQCDVNVMLVWHPKVYSAFRRWSANRRNLVDAVLEPEISDFDELRNDGALLVTDYSSISFDFAYLNKPVVYYQFDHDRMLYDRTYHRYPPDFNFRALGFGPVLRERRAVIDWVIAAKQHDIRLEEPYASRAKSFFTFKDNRNCKRVWAEIETLRQCS